MSFLINASSKIPTQLLDWFCGRDESNFLLYTGKQLTLMAMLVTTVQSVEQLLTPHNLHRQYMMVGRFGPDSTSRQYLNLYRAISQREGKEERNDR